MNIISAHSPQWTDAAQTHINLMVQFAEIVGEVPFTASLSDIEPWGATLYDNAVALQYGEIAAFPPILLPDAQATQIAAIESAYQVAIQQPIAYMGTTFQADTTSQNLMAQTIIGLQAIVAVGGAVPSDFGWWDANNVKVPMTLVQLQGLYATGVAAVNTAFARKQAKKSAVRSATTPAAVLAIIY